MRSRSAIELCDQLVLTAFELLELDRTVGEGVVERGEFGEDLGLRGDLLHFTVLCRGCLPGLASLFLGCGLLAACPLADLLLVSRLAHRSPRVPAPAGATGPRNIECVARKRSSMRPPPGVILGKG